MINYDEKVIEITQRLIEAKSYSGEEENVVKVLEKIFNELGFDDYHIDKYGNIVGRIKGKFPGEKILLDAHIDTVKVTDSSKWTVDPLKGIIKDKKIYGRGASDMKGALASMLCGAAKFAKDSRKEFSGEIFVSGVVHEECFEGVGAREVSEYVNPDYVIIGEASELNLKIGQRGRAEIVIEIYGESAHSANPDKGINAVYKAADLIKEIQKIETAHDEYLGYGILELVDIKSSPYPGASVVPDYCKITYDRRLLVGETLDSVLKPIQDLLDEMEGKRFEFQWKSFLCEGEEKCWTGNTIRGERFFPAWRFDKDSKFIKIAYDGLKEVGLDPEITNYSFCTNGSHYAGELGIKTFGFGPSRENLAHIVDEYIEIEELKKAVMGYYGIIKNILK